MVKKIFNFMDLKRSLFYVFLITIFLHFLKNTYTQYYYFLISIVLLSFIYLSQEYIYKSKTFARKNWFLIFLFFISFTYVAFISLIYQERWNHSYSDLLVSYGRLFISPIMCFILFGLAQSLDDIKKSLNLYVVIFFLAFLSILVQNFFGHLLIFGHDIYGLNENNTTRYGIIGYSSIIGSVTSYGVCFSTAVFIIYFNKKINFILKLILITSIFVGAILSMSKAAFINIFICLLIMCFFLKWSKNKYLVPLILIFMAILFFSFENLKIGTLGLYINTTGHEVVDGLKNNEHYIPIVERALNRIFFNFNTESFSSIKDYIFGIGVFGGGSVLVTNNPGTTHNTYLDIYTMGGFYFITIVIIVFYFCIHKLFKLFVTKNDETALILLLSNIVLFFNMFFFNGALFHPLISFSFWISIVYLFKNKNFI